MVNFIAKTTHPYSTVAIFQAGEGDRVAWAQRDHHKKMFTEDFELRAAMRRFIQTAVSVTSTRR